MGKGMNRTIIALVFILPLVALLALSPILADSIFAQTQRYMPVMHQWNLHHDLAQLTCAKGTAILLMDNDGEPTCVKPSTYLTLVDRGYGKFDSNIMMNRPMMMQGLMGQMMDDPNLTQQMIDNMMNNQQMMQSMMSNNQMMGMMREGMMGQGQMGQGMMGQGQMGQGMMGQGMMGQGMMMRSPEVMNDMMNQMIQNPEFRQQMIDEMQRHHDFMKEFSENQQFKQQLNP